MIMLDSGTSPPTSPKAQLDDGKMPKVMRSAEYIEHCNKGHPFDPKCEICIQGGTIQALKGALEQLNTSWLS